MASWLIAMEMTKIHSLQGPFPSLNVNPYLPVSTVFPIRRPCVLHLIHVIVKKVKFNYD